jgi:hypothetical protein
MVASTRRNSHEFRCRWDWCTATLASHDALRAHFAAEHEPALAPVTRREAAAMNAMSMGLLSDGDDSMCEWRGGCMRVNGTDKACVVRVLSAVRRKASGSPHTTRSTMSPARAMASLGAPSSWRDQDVSQSQSENIFSLPPRPDQAPSTDNNSRSPRGAKSSMSPARAMASLGRDSAGSQSQSDRTSSLPPQPASISSQDITSRSTRGARMAISPTSATRSLGRDGASSSNHVFSLKPQPASIPSQNSYSQSPPRARMSTSPAPATGQDHAGPSDHVFSLPQAERPPSPDDIFSIHPQQEHSPSLPRSSPSPSSPPRTPTYTRHSFAFQVAQSSPLVSPTPSSLRASPPLEEAIHAQRTFSLSPPPEYTPPRRGSSAAVESQLTQPPVLGKRRRPSPTSDTESDTPARASHTPVRAVSPPRFGRRSGEMKISARVVPPSHGADSDSDAGSSKESDDERPQRRARGSWVRDAVACIDELDITVDSGPPRTQAHRAFASSQPVDVY